MSEFGDYQLDPLEERGTIDLAEEAGGVRRRRRWPWWLLLALLIAAIGGWAYWKYRPQETEASPPPAVTRPEPAEPAAEPEEPVDLPELAESDPFLRDVVGQLSEHPQLAAWLVNDELAGRLVAAVVNIAEGESPRSHLPFLAAEEEFEVERLGDRIVPAPSTYARYDRLTAVVTSLHADGTARLYRAVRPLLDEAYRNLGYPDGSFDDVAARAVRVLLETPIVEDPELVEFASSYKYADPALEGLDPAQGHFLRFGPDNLRAIQARVRQIARRAGIEVPAER